MGLEVTGLVDQPREYDFSELAALPGQIADVSQLAPGREGAAVWLATVLSAVKPRSEARYITLQAEGGYSASVPLDAVADHAVILYRLDGEPLPAKLGGPLRFLIPDVAACQTAEVDACASVKYLRRIVISAERGKDTRPRTLKEHTAGRGRARPFDGAQGRLCTHSPGRGWWESNTGDRLRRTVPLL